MALNMNPTGQAVRNPAGSLQPQAHPLHHVPDAVHERLAVRRVEVPDAADAEARRGGQLARVDDEPLRPRQAKCGNPPSGLLPRMVVPPS